jgi:anti-sigma factor RsiW
MGSESTHVTENRLVCQELVELITDYLEDMLDAYDRGRFEAHIASCAHCTAYLAQMRRTLRLLGSLSEDSIPSAQRDALLEAFRDWKQTR